MPAVGACISGSSDNGDPLTDCLLRSLVHNAPRTGNILVSAQRHVEHADVVTLTIRNYPLNTLCDEFFSYATAFTYFYQHEFRFMGQTAIRAITELSITGSGNRRLCPVPLPGLYWLSRKWPALVQIFMSDDPVYRCHEIGMRIESRIDKSHRYAFSGIVRICI